jgi:hypothetical protein
VKYHIQSRQAHQLEGFKPCIVARNGRLVATCEKYSTAEKIVELLNIDAIAVVCNGEEPTDD